MHRICSVIVALMLLAAPAAANDGRQAASTAVAAARALQQQAVEAVTAGKRLDVKAAPAAGNLSRILDMESFDTLPAASGADMPWVLDWLAAVRDVNFTLVYFGADPKTPMQLAPAALERNVNEYEDEIARVMTFSLRFFVRVIAATNDFMRSLPEKERTSKVRLDGLARMNKGYLESIEGALGFAAAPGTKVANVRSVTAALHDTASVWIGLAQFDERERLAGFAATARSRTNDSETSDHLRAIEAALSASRP